MLAILHFGYGLEHTCGLWRSDELWACNFLWGWSLRHNDLDPLLWNYALDWNVYWRLHSRAYGFSIGCSLFRLKSHWFTLATIAATEIFKLIFISWEWVGGAAGLQPPIVSPELSLYYLQYAGPFVYAYIAIGILALEVVVLHAVVNSKIGFYLQAIREDEFAAMSVGINPFKYKMIAMFISAFFTGIGGGLYTVRFRFIDPFAVFDLITISVYIVVAGILGGIYTFVGPIVGSFIFMPITEYVRAQIVARFPRYYGLHVLVLGIILAVITLMMPEGVMGWLEMKGFVKRRIGIASLEASIGGGESRESSYT